MKSIGTQLFLASSAADAPSPRRGFNRVSARDVALPEAWFRDAIFEDPELVIGPIRSAGKVAPDETWLPWRKEHNFGSGPVDVLLVSSDGRVGIVETKLSYNPERRREVVAQILDYALSMQVDDFDDTDWPPLPAHEASPDIADLKECIEAGRFLLIVAGDALDPRAVRLSQAVLGRSMTSEWDLVMVDLNLFQSQVGCTDLLIVPELLGTVEAHVRNVVRVDVSGETGRTRVQVEHVASEGGSATRSPQIKSAESFLAMLESDSGAEVARRIVATFDEVSTRTPECFAWGFRSSTANLYWRTPEGGSRRIFSFSRNGAFRTWVGYLEKQGYSVEADCLRAAVKPLVAFTGGEQSVRTLPDANDLELHLSTIKAAALALTSG